MLTAIKICIFAVYSLAVCFFSYYLIVTSLINSYNDWMFSDNDEGSYIYDFIIVGAGSAGATVASELCQDKCNVLLIEAGPPASLFFDIPILGPLLQGSPYDWQYKTEPQKYACKGLSNNQSRWPQGKVLGGSSRLNNMAYVVGDSKDYETWFPEFSDYVLKEPIINGPRWNTNLADFVQNALLEILPSTDHDFRTVKSTMKNGERWSTDKLLDDKRQQGLRVVTHSFVDKLIIDRNVAKGVEFVRWGKKFKVFAKNAVIVSAGAIGSPKLLMLSGIGPKKHLETLGIDVLNDLPVGQYLVDHILTGLDLITLNISSPLSLEQLMNPISAINYSLFRHGPWTCSGIEAAGTIHASFQSKEKESPALQLLLLPVGISQDNGIVLRKSMGISTETFEKYFRPLTHRTVITIAPVLLHPKSFGEVKLASSNPFDDPLIDPKYLSREEDVSTLLEGLQLVKRLVGSKAMQKIGASVYDAVFPGCESLTFDSTEYWRCYIRHLTMTVYHPAGTCRIGSVVDDRFKVIGMKNLYIVDASVLPQLPSGNINAAVMMLAKKASALLVDRYRGKTLKHTNGNTKSSRFERLYSVAFFNKRGVCPRL